MRVVTPDTAGRGRHAMDSFEEHAGNQQRFSASGEKDRGDLTTEMTVLVPEFKSQRALRSAEDDSVLQHRSSASGNRFQAMFGNQQIVSLPAPKHLQPEKLRSDHDR